jgi:hypothetical protein
MSSGSELGTDSTCTLLLLPLIGPGSSERLWSSTLLLDFDPVFKDHVKGIFAHLKTFSIFQTKQWLNAAIYKCGLLFDLDKQAIEEEGKKGKNGCFTSTHTPKHIKGG